MVRTNQGGSILGFLVIGGIMALLLIGGVYLVRNNLVPAMGPGDVTVQNDGDRTPSSDGESDSVNDEEGRAADDDDTEDEPVSENLPGPLKIADRSQPETVKPDNESPENLPETGPGGILLSGILLSGIVAASLAYMRSRGLSVSL